MMKSYDDQWMAYSVITDQLPFENSEIMIFDVYKVFTNNQCMINYVMSHVCTGRTNVGLFRFYTLTSVCVRALPGGHF